jgi:hypothetical protein
MSAQTASSLQPFQQRRSGSLENLLHRFANSSFVLIVVLRSLIEEIIHAAR